MLIHEVVSRGARLHPQRTALKTGGDAVTYQQLDNKAGEISELIRQHGWRGAHGGLFADNSIEYAIGFFGIAKADGVVTPIATGLPAARLSGELGFCDVEYVITQPKYLEQLREAIRPIPNIKGLIVIDRGGRKIRVWSVASPTAVADRPYDGQPKPNDPAAMFATSGTAAEPKRVVLSHRNLISNVSSFLSVANLSPAHKGMIVLPMTAIGVCTTELLAYLAVGMTTRIYSGVFVLGEFCRVLEEEQAAVVNVSPFILKLMRGKMSEVAARIRSLRKLFFASAPMPSAQLEELIQEFPRVQFYYGYGQTEASPRCTTLLPSQQLQKLGSCGLALPDVEIRIVDDQNRDLPAGQTGEVVVRGPNVMLGYYKRPDLTSQAIESDWLHTGDYGYLDEDGFLFIKGRLNNVIITRGITVNPEEIEQEILAHIAVQDAYVSARSDDRLGERIVANVVLREGSELTEQQLKAFLRLRLAAAKIPARIEYVSELKRNDNNKLLRV